MTDSLFPLEELGAPTDPLIKAAPERKPPKVKAGLRVPAPPLVKLFWRWFPRQRSRGVANCERYLRAVQERSGLSDTELQERIVAWARHKPDMAPWELAALPPRPPVDVPLPRSPAAAVLPARELTEAQEQQARAHASFFQSVPFEDV